MSQRNEIEFEIDLRTPLAAQGWLYEDSDTAWYGQARALFPDVLAWLQATQPKAWGSLQKITATPLRASCSIGCARS